MLNITLNFKSKPFHKWCLQTFICRTVWFSMFCWKFLLRFSSVSVKCEKTFLNARKYSNTAVATMKYLNVAEKNDAAKSIAALLSNGTARRTEGLSPYNKLYSFQLNLKGQPTDMVMTSVSGHLFQQDFIDAYKQWQSCDPISLFDAPVVKFCPENYVKIKKTLEREVSLFGLVKNLNLFILPPKCN